MQAASESGASADSVHDLRTSIRRLSECLRTFEQFFPKGEADRVRRKLRKLMNLAAEVRNRDISRDLLQKAGAPPASEEIRRLDTEKAAAQARLTSKLAKWVESERPVRWRRRLGV